MTHRAMDPPVESGPILNCLGRLRVVSSSLGPLVVWVTHRAMDPPTEHQHFIGEMLENLRVVLSSLGMSESVGSMGDASCYEPANIVP